MGTKLETRTFDKFTDACRGKKVTLFGAGRYMPTAVQFLACHNIRIDKVVDNDIWKWGRAFCGCICASPDVLFNDKDAIVLICADYIFEIEKQLQNQGVDNYYALPLFAEQMYNAGMFTSMQIPLKDSGICS
jgi:hypothetical protein